MHWDKLKTNHYFKDPVEHIYTSTIFDLREYDKLYENQNDLSHKVWRDFDQSYKVGIEFFNDIRQINKDKEVICLWFFKERNDRSGGEDILLAGKYLKYLPNTFLITTSKLIKILDKKDEYIRRPFLQIDLPLSKYNEIVEKLR